MNFRLRSLSRRVVLLAAVSALLPAIAIPASARASFGIDEFDAAATLEDGSPASAAGSHPAALRLGLALNQAGGGVDGDLRDLNFDLPPGFLMNPTSASECSALAFNRPRSSPYEQSSSGEDCPNESQVGIATVHTSAGGGTSRHFGVFNLVPRYGSPGALGLAPFGVPIVFNTDVREADAGLTLSLRDLSQGYAIDRLEIVIWGTPWATTHNSLRGDCLDETSGGSFGSCLAWGTTVAPVDRVKSYLTLPTMPCADPLRYGLRANSWQGEQAEAEIESHDVEGAPVLLAKCNKPLTFATIALMTDVAASRTGMRFELDVKDGGGIRNPEGIARPPLRRAVAFLPEGLTINPSLGSGLATCSEADFAREGLATAPGSGCPNASKIGTVEVDEMLALPEPLRGSVFVATPYRNPYGSLLAVYIVASNPRRGLFVRSRGEINPDPRTGRLTATFEDLPRFLYKYFTLTLREGQRSVMVSPPSCGVYSSTVEVSSWADAKAASYQSTGFYINHGEGFGPCPSGSRSFQPRLQAGSINPAAGSYTPFYLHMVRSDADQEITSYSARLPAGLLANLSGIPYCPESAIASAAAKTGIEELANPSCPAASSIGHTISGYGVGNVLAYAPGGLYLAGPYHGAPLSTVAIDSALVGPFDLGTVVVRSAIRVDRESAVASIDSAGSDPIPHILGGIPLHLRDIRVYIDRPHFTLNPTSCNATSTLSILTGAGTDLFNSSDDFSAAADDRYQVANCTTLPYKPKLRFRVSGSSRHGISYPRLRTVFVPRAGDANTSFVSVTLPRSLFVAQSHLRDICTRAQFEVGQCPADSVYGIARAITPLLDQPLEGPVYLRSASPLPDIVFALKGPSGIEVDAVGRIDTVHGSTRATFSDLPDAPLSRFVMTLRAGKHSLLESAQHSCSLQEFANARMVGKNNSGAASKPPVRTRCARAGAKEHRR